MDTRFSVFGLGAAIALLLGAFNGTPLAQKAKPVPQPVEQLPRHSDSTQAVPSRSADTAVSTGRQLLEEFLGEHRSGPAAEQDHYQLGILFVTVPDPIDSHLDWAYDAQLNAVRRALERESYVIDLFWVPWTAATERASSGAATQRRTLHATHPGVLLFRRSDPNDKRLRLVYVVGEIPTSGVHKTALLTALREADSLMAWTERFIPDTTIGRELRIVGPVFSGSAPSLRRALDDWQRIRPGGPQRIRLVTGSASNTENKATLEDTLTTFAATVHDDRTLTRFQTEILSARMRISPRETAILRETSTQYGQRSGATPPSLDSAAIVIPFPMHISELRAEYARNPDELIVGPAMPGDRSNVRLPIHLGEKPRLADGPQLLSDLSPPAVDAMLDDIARTLNAHRIKAVGILATDARDVIFLGTEVRKRVRDVLLFTYGSNALYARRDVSEWLRGMLVVSTYPMTVESQFWDITQPDRQRVSFSGDMAEGMYNAVLLQLGDSAAAAMVDYGRPLSLDTISRPPIWITSVGRTSMLPITILPERAPVGAGSPRQDGTVNAYIASRRVPASPAGTSEELARGQEGRGAPLDPIVFALLVGLGFAWLMRDQLITAPKERHAARTSPFWLTPRVVADRFKEQLQPLLESMRRAHDWPARRRVNQVASLLAQREMYIVLRVAALTLVATGALLLLLRTRAHTSAVVFLTSAGVFLASTIGVYVIACSAWRLRTIRKETRDARRDFFEPGRWPTKFAWGTWKAEELGRNFEFVVGIGCLVASVWLAIDVMFLDDVASRSFFYRTTAMTAGVTPAIPLIVAGVLFFAWCVWNTKRITLLRETTAFEQMFFESEPARITDAMVRSIENDTYALRPVSPSIGVSVIPTSDTRSSTGHPGGYATSQGLTPTSSRESGVIRATTPTPVVTRKASDALPRTHSITDSSVIREHVHQVRARLFFTAPGLEGAAIFLLLLFLSAWVWSQFNATIEAAVLPVHLGLTTFDFLFRVAIIGAIGATIFGLYRIVGTWRALRGTLRCLADTPLVFSFAHLPATVARLTRLSPIDQPSDALIDAILGHKWKQVRNIERNNAPSENADAGSGNTMLVPAGHTRDDVPPQRFATLLDRDIGEPLAQLYSDLEDAWANTLDIDPASGSSPIRAATIDWGSGSRTGPTIALATDPRGATPQAAWMRTAGQCGAVYVIEYVEWVLHHLRNLAGFLLLSIVLITILLNSYAFQPESALKAVFFAVSLATVGGLVYVLLQMNRNDILSLITKTDPGRLSWDGNFTLNLALYLVVPVVTLLSSELPEVRNFLFSWVTPLLRALGKG